MKSNLFIKTVFPVLMAVALTACAAMQPTARALPPIRVEYTQWWGDYTLLVAQEKGFFAEYGVEVEPAYYEIFSDAYPDLAAGQLDAALLSTGDAMSVNRYTPIQIIGLEDDGGYMPIVANPEIKSLVDLRGKSVGTLVGTQYELIVTEMLASAGMTTADITISNLDPEDIPDALANGEIQAGFTWEPYTSQAIKKGAHIIYPMNNTLRLLPDAIIFRQSVIDQRPQDVQAFMRAWFKAVDYRLNYPEETRQIAAKYIGVPVEQIEPDPSQKIFTYEDNLALFTQSSTEANSIFNVMQKNAAYLIFNGSLAIMPDVKSIVTPRFLLQK